MKNTFLNPNAVAKTKRRSKTADLQTLCMLGLMGLALFALTACENPSKTTYVIFDTLEKIQPDDFIQ